MGKNKFKNGVRAVVGEPNKWDVNFQVNGERKTKRIDAKNFDAALAWRLAQKDTLRKTKESINSTEPVFDIDRALAKIKEKIINEMERGERNKTALTEFMPPAKRFFKDYPAYMGKQWTTTGDFTSEDIEGYKAYYRDVLNKPNGLSSEINKILNIMTHLYKEKFISSLRLFEFRQIKRPSKNVRDYIGNPDSDFIKVLLSIKLKKPRLFDFLSFIASTGRRPREVRQYLREFVNLEQNFIFVPSNKTKNKKANNVPLDSDLKKIVKRAMDYSRRLNSQYLFINDGGRQFSANNPQLNFQKAAKECGIPNWNQWCVYQLKKRFITTCRADGMSAEAISQVTGHRDLDSVMRNYSFPDKNQADRVLKSGRLAI